MDVRKPEWFARVKLTGVQNHIRVEGSVMSMFGEILKELQQTSPRIVGGAKRIEIVISDSFMDNRESFEDEREAEILNTIEQYITTESPIAGEDMVTFMTRLVTSGYPYATASILAADAFGYDPPQEMNHWLTDPRALRFRQLHASQAAHDAADPQELAMLKSYVCKAFPEYITGMKLRD